MAEVGAGVTWYRYQHLHVTDEKPNDYTVEPLREPIEWPGFYHVAAHGLVTQVTIRVRVPIIWDEANQMVIPVEWLNWYYIKFSHEMKCDHRSTMCNLCMESWLVGHQVMIHEMTRSGNIKVTKLDQVWENYCKNFEGYQPPSLEDLLQYIEQPEG